MKSWLNALSAGLADGGGAVLVTVAHAVGSTPRETGASMVVRANDIAGTIGGGHLEFDAIHMARAALAQTLASPPWIVRFPLAARLGQCCGGVATLAFVPLHAGTAAWLAPALDCARTATPFARVTRIGTADTTDDTQSLVVTKHRVFGTLADAAIDSAAIELARVRLHANTSGAGLYPAAAPDAGTTLLVHVMTQDDFPVYVFGNGHVGRALVQVLGTLPAQVRWVDGREHDFPPVVPDNCEIVITDTPEDELANAPRGAFVIVLTHSHALDFTLIEAAVRRDDWRYLGLIGSRSKRVQFERRLRARGGSAQQWSQVTCPIGTKAGLRSKEPGVIAVAVAAELLGAREAAAARDMPASAQGQA